MSTEKAVNNTISDTQQSRDVDGSVDGGDLSEISEQVLADIESFVIPEPDGIPGHESNIWTCERRLESHAQKTTVSYDRSEVGRVISELVNNHEIIEWFGLLAPATDEHLYAIIQNELLTDTPRKTLIGQCNTLRQTGGE